MNRKYLNDDWYFTPVFTEEILSGESDLSGLTKVRIPHSVCDTPYNCFDESVYQMVSAYVKYIDIAENERAGHVLLTFEGAAHKADVYVNRHHVYTHHSGYTAFTVDITDYLEDGLKQMIVVKLDSRENLDQPPFGNVIDYMTYGGIYRDVYIEFKDKYYIEDAYVSTPLIPDGTKMLKADITLNEYAPDLTFKTRLDMWIPEGQAGDPWGRVFDDEKIYHRISCLSWEVNDAYLWQPDQPVLYVLSIMLCASGKIIDEKKVRTGFREAVFDYDGFYLNGEQLKLRGLNRHQSWPYVGYAMPKSPQQLDADILKYELGCNIVRTSHYPQSQHFIDRCDEIGLLVFTEIPGWQHIGDTAWKKIAVRNVREMILQYRNHPSIILWGVRINESQDDDPFYYKTNLVAHELDSIRQTGGVRYLEKSHLYEDVYTFNDFVHNGRNIGVKKKSKVTSDMDKPYFISEYNGHMYPAKPWDDEPHLISHALRHAAVINDIAGEYDIAGGTGWCMFDYNTHLQFGSGDRVCYHGVLDMYRNPKPAAYVYKSQADYEPVLEIASSMNNGDHPACIVSGIYAFTNADSIKMYKNDRFISEFFPDRERFGYMQHPPVYIDDFVGDALEKDEGLNKTVASQLKILFKEFAENGMDPDIFTKAKGAALMALTNMSYETVSKLFSKYMNGWGEDSCTWRFEAIKNNKVIAEKIRRPSHEVSISVTTDKLLLTEETGYDVATVHFEAVDENGNHMTYYQEPLLLETDGDIELIGPKMISLRGGFGGTYVKSAGRSGVGKLIIKSNRQTSEIVFDIIKRQEK